MTGQVGLIEGSYDLPLKVSATAAQKQMTWRIEYSATVHLKVDRKGSTSATADATLETHGTAPIDGPTKSSMHIDTSSSGKLDTAASSMTSFTTVGRLEGSGTMSSIMGGTGGDSSGLEILRFDITTTLCEHATGTFQSKAFDSVVEGFKAKGFTTSAPASMTWEVGESSEARKEVDALKGELAPIEAGAGTDAASDASKLDALLTKINGKSDGLKKCLVRFWRESAMRVMGRDLQPKLDKLAAFSANGKMAQLDAIFDEALAVDRQYVKLGLDSCSDGQRPEFELLEAKAGALLTKAIADGNAIDIIKFDRQFRLVGGVEQRNGERTWEALQEITKGELEKAEKSASALLAPMRKQGGATLRCDDAAARKAIQVEAAADSQNRLVGGMGGPQATADAEFFLANCTK